MKSIVPALAVLLALPQVAAADQNDPRLDRLFAVIQTSDQPARARVAERAIWSIWLETEDADALAIMERGVDAMRESRLEDALAEFDTLVEAAPDFAEAWNKRATVHYMLGNLDESIADVEETLALEPRHFGALSGLGQIQILKRDDAAALDAFEQALAVHPHLANTKGIVEALRRSIGQTDL